MSHWIYLTYWRYASQWMKMVISFSGYGGLTGYISLIGDGHASQWMEVDISFSGDGFLTGYLTDRRWRSQSSMHDARRLVCTMRIMLQQWRWAQGGVWRVQWAGGLQQAAAIASAHVWMGGRAAEGRWRAARARYAPRAAGQIGVRIFNHSFLLFWPCEMSIIRTLCIWHLKMLVKLLCELCLHCYQCFPRQLIQVTCGTGLWHEACSAFVTVSTTACTRCCMTLKCCCVCAQVRNAYGCSMAACLRGFGTATTCLPPSCSCRGHPLVARWCIACSGCTWAGHSHRSARGGSMTVS